jgi:hypothetical protein
MRIFRALVPVGLLVGAAVAVPVSSAHQTTAAVLAAAVSVSPSPVINNNLAYVSVRATVGAACSAKVTYSNKQKPSSFNSSTSFTTASNGAIAWFWNPSTSAKGGVATVVCSMSGHTVHATSAFVISQKS